MFTTLPNNFDSLHGECIFAFSEGSGSDSTSDIVVDILNSDTNVTLSVKKFYSASDYQVNVSPVVKAMTYPNIVVAQSGFVASSQIETGVMRVHIADDSQNESSSVILTQSQCGEPQRGFVSSMPKSPSRVIARGERELIRLYVDADEVVSITQRQYANTIAEAVAEVSYQGVADAFGFATFSLLVDYLPEQYEVVIEPDLAYLELDLCDSDGVVIETLRYIVIDPPYDPIRVAWVSKCATIEHYTFPNVVERMVTNGGVEHLTLRSAPECDAMRDAIAEAVQSPRLWVVRDGEYHSATMCSESIDLTPRAELTTMQLEIEY